MLCTSAYAFIRNCPTDTAYYKARNKQRNNTSNVFPAIQVKLRTILFQFDKPVLFPKKIDANLTRSSQFGFPSIYHAHKWMCSRFNASFFVSPTEFRPTALRWLTLSTASSFCWIFFVAPHRIDVPSKIDYSVCKQTSKTQELTESKKTRLMAAADEPKCRNEKSYPYNEREITTNLIENCFTFYNEEATNCHAAVE